jgi:hypothetical protein
LSGEKLCRGIIELFGLLVPAQVLPIYGMTVTVKVVRKVIIEGVKVPIPLELIVHVR